MLERNKHFSKYLTFNSSIRPHIRIQGDLWFYNTWDHISNPKSSLCPQFDASDMRKTQGVYFQIEFLLPDYNHKIDSNNTKKMRIIFQEPEVNRKNGLSGKLPRFRCTCYVRLGGLCFPFYNAFTKFYQRDSFRSFFVVIMLVLRSYNNSFHFIWLALFQKYSITDFFSEQLTKQYIHNVTYMHSFQWVSSWLFTFI